MKNDWAIINSGMTKNQRDAAYILRETYSYTNTKSISKVIKLTRKSIEYSNMNINEEDLKVACLFHNILDYYK